MMEIVASNVVSHQPPKQRPPIMSTTCANNCLAIVFLEEELQNWQREKKFDCCFVHNLFWP